MNDQLSKIALSIALCGTLLSPHSLRAASPPSETTSGEWRYYGGDPGSTKYSPLDQINRANVSELKIAWSWDSPDLPLQKGNRMLSSFAYENTPLMVGGTLYASTSLCQIAAINAQTGKTVWVFDPQSYKVGRPTNLGFVQRGVAYWTDGKRIVSGSDDQTLKVWDATSGQNTLTLTGHTGRVTGVSFSPDGKRIASGGGAEPVTEARDNTIKVWDASSE
jgi:quinoprotein glucose dehydrogenase